MPEKEGEGQLNELRQIKYIDSKYIDTPDVAIAQARAEIIRMGRAVEQMYDDVVFSLKDGNLQELSKWRKREDTIDNLQKEIIQFLVQVVQRPITPEESKEVASLMRMANNLERAGDGVENIAELIEELLEQRLTLSEGGLQDFETIAQEVRRFLGVAVDSIQNEDKAIMPGGPETRGQDRSDARGNEGQLHHAAPKRDVYG